MLRQKRTELGLSIAEVSKNIKIRDTFLTAIENNDKTSVPDSYYDLFVKKYADFLSIDLPGDEEKKKQNDAILDMLTENVSEKKRRNQLISGLKKILLFGYVHRKFVIAFLIIFLLFLFTKHIYNILNDDEKNEKNESMVKIITIEGDPDDKISVAIRDSFMLGTDISDFFDFKISAVDTCYIYYYTDTMSVKESMLFPGSVINVRAEKIIEAKFGKSGAVDLEFNNARVLNELKDLDNASAFVRVSNSGAEKIKRSDKIINYLKNTYGIE